MSASLSKILTLSVSDILKKLIEYTLGNVYAHLFGDIAVPRLVGIMNLIMGYTEPKD